MQMLFESSFSFCSQQVTTRLQSGEAATAGEEGVNRTVARQSSRAAPAGVHHGGPRGARSLQQPKRNNSTRQQTAAAEQQQTAAATARPVAARWKPQFKQHAKIHHYPGALPPGWVGLAGGVEARSSSNKINSGHSSSSARQGKRDKYHYEVECVTDVPIGCILNR
jgi:transglutaminase/protease-like cytokinesis protein 3